MKDMFMQHKKFIVIGSVVVLFLVGGIASVITSSENTKRANATSEKQAAAQASSKKVASESAVKKTGNAKTDAMIDAMNAKLAEEFKVRLKYNEKGGKAFKWAGYIAKVEYFKAKQPGVKIQLNEAGMKLKKADLFKVTEEAQTFATGVFYNVAGDKKKQGFSEDDLAKLFDMKTRQQELSAVLVDMNDKTLHTTSGPNHLFNEAAFNK